MSSTRNSRSKTSKRRSTKKTNTRRAGSVFKKAKWMLIIFALISLPVFIYGVYLNHEVTRQFEGKRFSIPARVYARSLELFVGQTLASDALEDELKQLKYSKVLADPMAPGEYQRRSTTLRIFLRPFTYWDGVQEASLIELAVERKIVKEIVDLQSHQTLDLVRVEPLVIGGIYPNSGEDRELVRLEQVPKFLIDALVAVEDKRYYSHHGVDPKAVLRALTSVFSGGRVQGGSTLTQQLVKNFFLTRDRTLKRKFTEVLMALLLEYHYSKNDILETYLNEVYFGQDGDRAVHGFALASQFYFSRSLEHIDVHQAAMLVGLLKGPTYYNPRTHLDRAKNRRDLVLKEMVVQGLMGGDAYQRQIQQPLLITEKTTTGQSLYPAFTDLVIRQLKRDYREEDLRSEGLRIFTTLDPIVQQKVERVTLRRLSEIESSKKYVSGYLEVAAIFADVPSGEIVALVGGRRSGFQGFNRALDANRQIGSLIKPAMYITALSHTAPSGLPYTLTTPLDDSPFVWRENGIDDWQPQNYDGEFHGQVPLWLALAKSYNVAAARLGTELGVNKVMDTVQRLGVEKTLPTYASGLLGTVHLTPYEVTQMYHTIASGGFKTPFRAIREVTTQHGDPLKRYNLRTEPAVNGVANYLVTSAMQQVVKRGTGVGLNRMLSPELNVAGKTGTTDDLRDSWYAGFSGDRVAVVWIGNDENKTTGLTGASGAMTVWGEAMSQLNPRPLALAEPDNIEWVAIDEKTGDAATKNCKQAFTLPFVDGTAPAGSEKCSGRVDKKIKGWFKRIFGKD
ncbi:MAG: penicillin-binding protein 1B [Lentisphaeria bacterium]|jgi:penicillin-binding protein 1B